ncbi:AAA family ATPase [Marinithermus hydrothermalis]|uniref:SMC domain protein n=1 Tax=Marinithermus hydrothermalis (strain DSM 14884 / JCM 11576 / T1) TaxID=869210 RepID=F2NLF9_MARHT|nr:SMC family ATPase [Marinithermus hydrothermalis]AEB12058.1 SMC domain protein [Marinithermus hydrothermalis DSM 14884]
MRPLRLVVAGFGAYREPQEIPFDDVELFAITGPTGSGKSTLLDAICFALYGKTPRAGGRGFRELKHPGVDAARVSLEFSVGSQVYRVVRTLGTRENQHRLEALEDGRWRTLPESDRVRTLNQKLEAILGLDYDAFIRAILLPQGEFDLFLKGDASERRELLSALYGLEGVAAMRERAMAHLKEAEGALERVEGALGGLEATDEAALEALREEIAHLEREEAEANRRLEAAQQALKEVEARYARHVEHEKLRRRHAAWKAEAARIERIRERLAQAERAERIWPHLEALERAQQAVHQAARELAETERRLKAARTQRDRLLEAYDPAALERVKLRQAELEHLRAQEERLLRYGGGLDRTHSAPLPFDEARVEALREAQARFRDLQQLKKNLGRAQARLEEERRQLNAREAEHARLAEELAALEREGKALRAQHETARARLEEARQRAGVLAYRALLRPGEPCPLCGQTVHRVPEGGAPDLDALERAEREAKERLEALREAYLTCRARRDALQEGLPAERNRVEELAREVEEWQGQVRAVEAELGVWPGPEAVAEELERRLAGLAAALREATDGRGVAAYARALQAQRARLEAQAQRLEALARELQALEERHGRLEEARRERERTAAQLEASVEALLREGGFAHPEEVRAARLADEERQAWLERVQAHEQEGVYLEGRLRDLEQTLETDDPVTEEAVRAQRQAVEALQAQLRALGQKLGERRAVKERMEQDLERKRALLAERARLVSAVDVWQRLAQDLKGGNFPDYLLNRYQVGLVQRASELLKTLSSGRYRFRLHEGEYYVEDLWTEAVRSARTLSGGETFLASLSLALALSEHLSRGRLGALFLDEGFGTLDQETLELAAGVLETLPTQGRLVGVVTHVIALAERFPARLVVEKHPAGSRVRWEA